LLELAITLWRERPDSPVTELTEDLSVSAASEWLMGRIVTHLRDKRTQLALQRGVILQYWTLEVLKTVCKAPNLDQLWYDRFIRYPFVQMAPIRRGWHTFIRPVREIQLAQLWRQERADFHSAHGKALDWYRANG
jgi:hypothetical protein